MYEALALQGSAVLIKDAKKNKAYFVSKKNVSEWHNGNSAMLPKMDTSTFVDPSPFDRITTDAIREYLISNGVRDFTATRIQRICIHSEIDTLGDLYRIGKKSALGLRDMGEGSISELSRIFKERFNSEWK